MPHIPTGELIAAARHRDHGVAAFNVIQLEHAEGIVAGAESIGAPVVLQVSQNCVRYHGALEPIATAMLALARTASIAVSVHLDHAESVELVEEAVRLGIGSVMFDASALDHGENQQLTAEVARYCHGHSVWAEAELGRVGGKDGAHAPWVRTDPDEAAAFVAATGVDALAVAVGSSHAMTERIASLDHALIARLRDAIPVPLVLHGSSGVPDDELAAAIAAGMTKVNIATQLNKVFTAAVREYLATDTAVVDTRKYFAAGRHAIADEAARLLRIVGSPAT